MKVFHLLRSLDPATGGPGEAARQLALALAERKVESTLACLDPPQSSWLEQSASSALGLGPVRGTYGYRRHLPQLLRSLTKDHDAVIVHGLWQYHAYATWRAFHGSTTPFVVYPHGMLDPWFHRSNRLKEAKKWLYWPWGDYRVLRDAHAVLFTAERERRLARESFWLYAPGREEVVGLGIATPPGDPTLQRQLFLSEWPQLQGKRLWLFLSRLHPKKGVDQLIDAFAAVAAADRAVHLVIAGPDQVGWKGELQARADALGMRERITWPGMLSGDQKWGAFRSAEVFCLPSHQENFGIVVAEALACGLPVLLGEPVNISDEVAAAGAGIVHPDTLDGTISAMRQWFALDETERTRMGRRAQELFLRRFEIEQAAAALLAVLTSHR